MQTAPRPNATINEIFPTSTGPECLICCTVSMVGYGFKLAVQYWSCSAEDDVNISIMSVM